MTKTTSRSKWINKTTNVTLLSANPEALLDSTLWAINWFDLKSGWLYQLYNKVVVKHVKQVGGIPLFKGKLRKVIRDNHRLQREMILIVSYPKADAFLKMISNSGFQRKSILRLLSVKDFVFGFHERKDDGKILAASSKFSGKLKYLVHVLPTRHQKIDALKLKDIATGLDIFTHFIGNKTALLGVDKKNNGMQTVPFPIENILIFSAFEDNQFDELLSDPYCQTFSPIEDGSFIGLYNQLL